MDASKGGNISDMAVSGTKVPDDAGKQNTIPSKPNPGQMAENAEYHKGFINAGDIQGAADNAHTTEVVTGTGDQMPAEAAEAKHLSGGTKFERN